MNNKPRYIGTHLITCACVRVAPDGEWIGNPALCDCKTVCGDETHKGYGLTGCLDCEYERTRKIVDNAIDNDLTFRELDDLIK